MMPCAAGRRGRLLWKILCVPIFFTIAPPGQCEFSSSRAGLGTSSTDELDYDVHVPLAAVPLGVNVGYSLKVVSFRKNSKTGELPWIARRGWLAVGDTLVSLEGEDILEFSPADFADEIQRVVESKRDTVKPPGVEQVSQDAIRPGDEKATEFITLRVRPGDQPGRATRMNSMYSPPSQDEADEELARWHLRYSTGPTSLGVSNVTVSAFGGEPDSCEARPVVAARPEDGCSPLYNAPQVTGAHVLVRRGGCSFFAKALIIRNSGGGSVVVIDEGAGKLRMEAEQGEKVDIPVVMVSKFDGDILRKAAGSTSRATGKLTGTLIVTPSCLPREAPVENRAAFQRRLSHGGDGPSIQASQSSLGDSSLAMRSVVADTRNGIGKENTHAKMSTTARADLERMGDTGHGGNKTVDTAADERGGQDGARQCRERSAGPLRGGDLILESTHGTRKRAEFLSTLVTGSLTVDGSNGIPVAHEKGSENDGALVVDILSVCDSTAPEVSALRATQRGVILLLPPDPNCEVARQVHLGAGLSAAVVVVVAEAAPTGVHTTATFLTTNIDPKLLSPIWGGSHAVDDDGKYIQGREFTKRIGENDEATGGTSERRTMQSTIGLSSDRESDRKPDDEVCQPLTVVVSHDEGTEMLEWVRQVRGGGAGRDDTVTARLVEREGVGRLWGDVVWASDPRNWPTGSTQRRRIINRLRKTHSPEHAGGSGGAHTTSATRWLLLQEAYAVLDVQSDPRRSVARQDTQPTSGDTSRDVEL